MHKSRCDVISLNPTAPPFTYVQHTARSKSSSSSSATSLSGASTTTQTSHSTIHSTKFDFPTQKFKEFVPRNQSILNSHPTEFPLTATSVLSSERSEIQLLSGIASSKPSDTTFTIQDGTKPEDMLLSMKMKSIEFSQTYYLKRAAELGISLHLESVTIHGKSRRDGSIDGKPSYNFQKSITVSPRTTRDSSNRKQMKSKYNQNSSSPNRRVGDVWDGYVVQAFTTRKVDNLRDWEWDNPVPEMVSEVVWSEDDEAKTTIKMRGDGRGRGIGAGGSDGVADSENGIIAAGEYCKKSDGRSGGDGVGSATNTAPRGKSWMIVTQKMIDEYFP